MYYIYHRTCLESWLFRISICPQRLLQDVEGKNSRKSARYKIPYINYCWAISSKFPSALSAFCKDVEGRNSRKSARHKKFYMKYCWKDFSRISTYSQCLLQRRRRQKFSRVSLLQKIVCEITVDKTFPEFPPALSVFCKDVESNFF